MKVTVVKGKQNKIHISCDGEYMFTVDAEYWFSSPYHGRETIEDDEELTAFYQAVGSRCAFIAGLRLLSYRDHSSRELVTKLVQKGHKREYSEAAVEKLSEYGYVNDERYASYLASSLLERKGMNSNAIRSELLRKGISREISDNVVESLDIDPVFRIIDLLNTKYSRKISDEKGVKRTVASLQRLGYKWSDINTAFHRLEIETEDTDDV
ncbi:MAG: regulatory protein RecX [Ruminococcaceae bacterium]|nr:regulatory protein RecX [Oscillospiraceae bacterium]